MSETRHNDGFNELDHVVKLKEHANWILESEFDDDLDPHIEELIGYAEEMGQLLACYRKHKTGKEDPNRFKQYCPLCWECIHCKCVIVIPV